MFGMFKKSKIVRKSDNLDNTKTKWFNGQKVKIKSGTTRSGSQKIKILKIRIQLGLENNHYQFQK